MIVVLDTNVVVSALLSAVGSPAEIIRRWEADEFEEIISSALLEELERALSYPQVARYLKLPKEQIDAFLKSYLAVATLVKPEVDLDVVQVDPGDNKVLECAVEGNASYIVTGDRHLLDLGDYLGIAILSPAGFVYLLDHKHEG